MNLEVLVATMYNEDFSIVNEMNIKTDAIIINQCNENKEEIYKVNNNVIKKFSYNEKGLARSRNRALEKASGEICIIADDDVIYEDNYKEIILNAFKENPKADIIIFNIQSLNYNRKGRDIKKITKVNKFNYMRYGSCRIAFRRNKIEKFNIKFDELFGAGGVYTSGEDTIFMSECLKKGLSIYTNPGKIANVKQESSSWFNGYNKKFFFDKGAIFARINPKLSGLLNCQFILRKYKLYKNDISIYQAWKEINNGKRMYLDINSN